MNDTSLLDELIADERARKSRLKYYIPASVLLLIIVIIGAMAALRNNASGNTTQEVATQLGAVDTKQPSQSSAQPKKVATKQESPKKTGTTSSTVVDESATDAAICRSVIDGAEEASKSYLKMYYDAQKDWLKAYGGDSDTPEAQEDKEWYINHFKKEVYGSYIATANPTYKSACGGGSITDVIVQPDYSAW